VSSKSKTYDGDQWVRVEVLVLGGEKIKHMVENEVVLEYERPQIGGGSVSNFDPAEKQDGKVLTEGTSPCRARATPSNSGRSNS